jgi:Family of unknown function (DUF5372)
MTRSQIALPRIVNYTDPHDRYRRVRVTHPFHLLAGREFEFVACRQNWGEDRVHLHDENGQLFSLDSRPDLPRNEPFPAS